jgi:hypothetical protein
MAPFSIVGNFFENHNTSTFHADLNFLSTLFIFCKYTHNKTKVDLIFCCRAAVLTEHVYK